MSPETVYLVLSQNHIVPQHPAHAAHQEGDAEVVVHHNSPALEAGGQTEDAGGDQKQDDGDAETSYRYLVHCHPKFKSMASIRRNQSIFSPIKIFKRS